MKTHGAVPKWSNGADCKSVGPAYGGSNPPRSTYDKINLKGALMPSWLIGLFIRIAEGLLPHLLSALEDKYPGIKVVVNAIKEILGDANATVATPNQLVEHLRKF